MAISATLFGLSIGSITPARAMLAIVLGTSGFAWVEHEAERTNDSRRLIGLALAMLFGAWAIDVRADDGPVGIAGPVIEVILGAGLVGAVALAVAARGVLARSRWGSSRVPIQR